MPPPNHSERIESLEDQVRSLLAALEARSAPAPPPSENASVQHSFRSKEPEVFAGEWGHLEPFLAQVDVFLRLNPGRFINDSDLILWLSTLLRGVAHQWFYPHLSAVNPPAWLTDYPLFISQLRVVFGDPDRIATAKQEIEALSQTTSVAKCHGSECTGSKKALGSYGRSIGVRDQADPQRSRPWPMDEEMLEKAWSECNLHGECSLHGDHGHGGPGLDTLDTRVDTTNLTTNATSLIINKTTHTRPWCLHHHHQLHRHLRIDIDRAEPPLNGVSTELLRKEAQSAPFAWNNEAQHAFEQLRSAFGTDTILHHFDPTRPIIVETDASDFAVAAVLSQSFDQGTRHPIAFFSKKLDPAQLNYPIFDKEMFAIVAAFKHWRQYLEGAKFPVQVLTDHRSLEYFTTTKQLNRRQARWSELLSNFDFVIQYRPGAQAGLPDTLTRRSDMRPMDKGPSLMQEHNPNNFQALLKPHQL
ncbi:uncharacterized protein UHOD_11534 [Ustilago sp. UG-2017b]|nr:uncharacterized protein UHOD_11534 [Ustilago sp. UG-2017b]